MKQRVTPSTTARLIEMGFRFFRAIFRGPEGERKFTTGNDQGKWSIPTEPSGTFPPLLRGFHTPRRCNHTLAFLPDRSSSRDHKMHCITTTLSSSSCPERSHEEMRHHQAVTLSRSRIATHPAFRISITSPASLSSIVIGVPSFIPESLLSPCCTAKVCSPSGVITVIAFISPDA